VRKVIFQFGEKVLPCLPRRGRKGTVVPIMFAWQQQEWNGTAQQQRLGNVMGDFEYSQPKRQREYR